MIAVIPLAEPVDEGLVRELTSLGTKIRRGHVIAAVSGSQHQPVAAAIERRGLDCQIVTNRSELMILPTGVSKASGLEYALEALGGVTPHNLGNRRRRERPRNAVELRDRGRGGRFR